MTTPANIDKQCNYRLLNSGKNIFSVTQTQISALCKKICELTKLEINYWQAKQLFLITEPQIELEKIQKISN